MTMPILTAIVALVIVVILAACVAVRCAHRDADGHSALYWQRDRTGRLCGWCPICGRMTRGWRIG